MKHRIFGKKLGRNHNERKALFNAQIRSIFTYGSIKTTEAKAKSLLPLVENLSSIIIKRSDLDARRELFRYLQDQTWVNNVVTTLKSVYGEQISNFTTVKKIKRRQGDDTIIVQLGFTKPISFVKKAEKVEKKEEKKKEAVKKVVKKTKEVKPKVKKETK
jgi:large subunit ribosomal protein L17